MGNIKRRSSSTIIFTIVILLCMMAGNVFAAAEKNPVYMSTSKEKVSSSTNVRKDICVLYNGVELEDGAEITVQPNSKIGIYNSSFISFNGFESYWTRNAGNGLYVTSNVSGYYTRPMGVNYKPTRPSGITYLDIVGEPGEVLEFSVCGTMRKTNITGFKNFKFKIADEEDKTETETKWIVAQNLKENKTVEMEAETEIYLRCSSNNDFSRIKYCWNDDEFDSTEIRNDRICTIKVPEFDKCGKHKLIIKGVLTNGEETEEKVYYIENGEGWLCDDDREDCVDRDDDDDDRKDCIDRDDDDRKDCIDRDDDDRKDCIDRDDDDRKDCIDKDDDDRKDCIDKDDDDRKDSIDKDDDDRKDSIDKDDDDRKDCIDKDDDDKKESDKESGNEPSKNEETNKDTGDEPAKGDDEKKDEKDNKEDETVKDNNGDENNNNENEEQEEEPEEITGSVKATIDGKSLSKTSVNIIEENEVVKITGTPKENFKALVYSLDDAAEVQVSGASADVNLKIQDEEIHTLVVRGILNDDTETGKVTYKFMIRRDEEIIVESGMTENKSAKGLLVSLRNDTEKTKANKNMYKLKEEVIYYVDYKNCGEDINGKVELVLKLPINNEPVETSGGTLSKSNKIITWTFEDGLNAGESGTKRVVLKYTKLSSTSSKYETIYPIAEIYEEDDKMNDSSVINFIYLSETTVIPTEHKPYMFGDEEKPTFRPDDNISRAEGTLVLTRIFEIDTSNVEITDRFSDLNETYLEAQKAITAASELGIINGYTDGTFRPNEKMTRAEFMKVIASYIEVKAKQEGITGLSTSLEDEIKTYENEANSNHWAIPYVTLLMRLNMSGIETSDNNLRINDKITRAEVAQLVNFYSFRAPADVSKDDDLGFRDVSSKHALFEDIAEATRAEHKYSITDEGKEIAK